MEMWSQGPVGKVQVRERASRMKRKVQEMIFATWFETIV